MAKRVMTSMEMDDDDAADAPTPIAMSNKETYPYGLRICLTEKEMAKLNLDETEAVVGGICHIHGLARITSVNHSESAPNDWGGGGKQCRIELQIEDLSIESEDAENDGK